MTKHPEDNHSVHAAQRAVAIASHEIRGSLAAIVAHAELVVDGELTPDRREEVTRIIARNGRSLLALLDDVLFASRIDAGAERAEPSPCSVAELLDDLIDLHGAEAEARGLYLELEIDRGLPARIMTDAVHLRRILLNLTGNAIKFTEQGGVRIRAEQVSPGRLRVSVEDTGIGLHPEELERMFEPFVQSEHRTPASPGSGLGLAISRELAQLLGGSVTATSRPGAGSTFTLDIPITPCSSTSDATGIEGLRVLVAEDCPDTRLLMQHHLEGAGAHPVFVSNGVELVDRLASPAAWLEHDIVLVDLEMPLMNGFEATRRLRARGCDLPVLALSAHEPRRIGSDARRHGCDDCLAKPVEPTRLLQGIGRWCGMSPRRCAS